MAQAAIAALPTSLTEVVSGTYRRIVPGKLLDLFLIFDVERSAT